MDLMVDPSVQFSGCPQAVLSAEGILPFSGRMVSRYVPNSCLAALLLLNDSAHLVPRASSPKEMWNALCDLSLTMRMLWHGIFTFLFINAVQPWHLQYIPLSRASLLYSVLLQPSEASRCLHLRGEPQGGCSVPRLCFPYPRNRILQLSNTLWKTEPGNCACEFPICLSVCLQWETAIIGTGCFVEIGMICLRCLELSDTELCSPLSVQREALIKWEVVPPLLDTSWRGWIFLEVNFFHALWTGPMEITQAEGLICSY